MEPLFSDIDETIKIYKNGGMIIVVDDESRENEGDLIVAAEHITTDQMTFIINHTTGIVCIPITQKIANKMNLTPMTVNNKDLHETAFTISCDSVDTGTGVSAEDRLKTVKSVLRLNPKKIRKPGHMFPLVAKPRLLKERQGHTEAAVSLCKLANLKEVAVISELKNNDGTMKNRKDCFEFWRAS